MAMAFAPVPAVAPSPIATPLAPVALELLPAAKEFVPLAFTAVADGNGVVGRGAGSAPDRG